MNTLILKNNLFIMRQFIFNKFFLMFALDFSKNAMRVMYGIRPKNESTFKCRSLIKKRGYKLDNIIMQVRSN